VEITNGVVTNVFDDSNSPLKKRHEAPGQGEFVAGIAFDSKGTMWVVNSNTSNILLSRDKTGTWKNNYLGSKYAYREVLRLAIDSYDNKWLIDRSGKIIVYNEKDGGADREIGPAAGLDKARAYFVVEDKNQSMWVGTNDGIFIIRNLNNILSNNPLSIDRPKLTLGGHVDYLLKGELINYIVVNGANEKWCLSSKNGVYKITSDGTTELFHLTAQNSPFFSNNMMGACITDNGEVFFATEQGIVYYRDEAKKGTESNSNVYAFPNPVKPDYQGPIAISGVVDMADIKITDVAGNLVYATQAKGGQAIWDAKDFNGKRVRTGVYIVFITNEDGTETTVTKIMVLN
jgi:ligand-binding sensor domain-containing protein